MRRLRISMGLDDIGIDKCLTSNSDGATVVRSLHIYISVDGFQSESERQNLTQRGSPFL